MSNDPHRTGADFSPTLKVAPAILVEFMKLIQDIGGAHYYAMLGLWKERREIEALIAAKPIIAGRTTWIAAGPPEEQPARVYLSWPTQELVYEKLGRDGAFSIQLSNAWVTGLFSAWESKFRKEIGRVLGLGGAEELSCDEMGDLRLMRNDILHNRSIASREHTGRCRSLRWFEQGQQIRVDTSQVYEFHKKIGPQIGQWTLEAVASQ